MSITHYTSARNGARLNNLYQQYQQQPNSGLQDTLFAEIQNYAERLVTDFAKRESVPTDYVMDSVQEACLKVLQRSESFKHKSKFSTWVFTIVRNAFYDELRQDSRRKESELLDWKSYNETSGKTTHTPSTQEDDDGEDSTRSESVPFLSQREIDAEQDKLNLQLDRQRLEALLSDEDYEVLQDLISGMPAAETAKRLRVKTKHVYNRRQVIKNRALDSRKSVPIARTISAKDAEALAQGNRRAQQFARAYWELEKQRWDKLTVVSPWHSPHQVFPVENRSAYGAIAPNQRTGVGKDVPPRPPISLPEAEITKIREDGLLNIRLSSGVLWYGVEPSVLRTLHVKPLSTQPVTSIDENLPDWVSKIPLSERQSRGEGFSLPT